MFHDFSQLFVQEINILDKPSLKFADRSTVNSCDTPLRQIHSAIPIWEVTELFHQLRQPWGEIMRHFSVAHEDSITKALSDPTLAEEHLLEAQRHLSRFNTIWDVMSRIVKDGKQKPYCDESSAWEAFTHLGDSQEPEIVIDALKEHWGDIYSNLYTIASYAIPSDISYLDRPEYGKRLLDRFFEYVRPHLVGEAYLIYENNEPYGEDVPYCDLECALWQLIGVLGDSLLESLEIPPEIFTALYLDAQPVVYRSTFN
jgi:hypothetical protein